MSCLNRGGSHTCGVIGNWDECRDDMTTDVPTCEAMSYIAIVEVLSYLQNGKYSFDMATMEGHHATSLPAKVQTTPGASCVAFGSRFVSSLACTIMPMRLRGNWPHSNTGLAASVGIVLGEAEC